jgi:outer membrane receptor protein involved in Fe transport
VRDHNPSMSYGRGAYFLPARRIDSAAVRVRADVRADARSGVRRSAQHVRIRIHQDDFRISSTTTLNLGLRYDIEKIANVRNYTASTDGNNLQPRFGMAWRPLSRTIVPRRRRLYTQQHCSTTSTVSSSKAPMAW